MYKTQQREFSGEYNVITQTIPVSQARQKFGELINRVYRQQVRIIVEKSGIPVAALVSLADLERWSHQDRDSEGRTPTADRNEEGSRVSKAHTGTSGLSREELDQRRALVARILEASKDRVISPMTTADLVHQVREEEERSHGAGRH